jgi:hypothetical protein
MEHDALQPLFAYDEESEGEDQHHLAYKLKRLSIYLSTQRYLLAIAFFTY